MDRTTLFWRRIDVVGLERFEVARASDGITARGTVLVLEGGGFELLHRWRMSPEWRVQSVEVERTGSTGTTHLVVERHGDGWRVDGASRPDLDGAEEPDLSVTPFCNTFPIRRLPAPPGSAREVDVCLVDAESMTVTRARQRYERIAGRSIRFTSLDGASAGFTARLDVDDDGFVLRYEHLFDRVEP